MPAIRGLAAIETDEDLAEDQRRLRADAMRHASELFTEWPGDLPVSEIAEETIQDFHEHLVSERFTADRAVASAVPGAVEAIASKISSKVARLAGV